ncbi:hypothetical protein [Flavobacterium sp. 3HN19-14]|uniref:hypothetical protein n=1 Tax=Flavobacterium sp. 3HN19-14 TaxID=3448133 RepID=UPI003EDF6C97
MGKMRHQHLQENLQHSIYTDDLFLQYRKHLGAFRYRILLESQALVVPAEARKLLGLRKFSLLFPLIKLYKLSRKINGDLLIKEMLIPEQYKKQVMALDVVMT